MFNRPNQMSKQPINGRDLFDNPMVSAAKKSMSKEDIEKYEAIGESMYSIDFEKCGSIEDNTVLEALAYVNESIKSGIHPSMLSEPELVILETSYGREWYKKFGYVKEDLKEIVTLVPNPI